MARLLSAGQVDATAASSWSGTPCGFFAALVVLLRAWPCRLEVVGGSGPDAARREELVVLVLAVVEERCRAPVRLKKRLEERLVEVVLERVGGKNSAGGESGGELGPRVERRRSKAGAQGV